MQKSVFILSLSVVFLVFVSGVLLTKNWTLKAEQERALLLSSTVHDYISLDDQIGRAHV